MSWEHVGAKPCQNHGGPQKKQSFSAKTLECTKKTKSFGVLRCQITQCSKTLRFLACLVRSSVLAPKLGFFATLPGFGKVLLQNAPKTLRCPKKPKFWCQNAGGYQKNPKNLLEHWVVWHLKTPNFGLFSFVGTIQRFGPKTLVFLGPSMVLARFCSKMLPSTGRSQKTQSGHGF